MTRTQMSRLAIRIASDRTGIPPWQIVSPQRVREVVEARNLAALLMRRSGLSLPAIGAALNRDHTTIFYAIRKMENAQ